MTIEKKIITKDSLEKLYEKLKQENKMVAPVMYKDKVNFIFNPAYRDITYDYIQTVQSVKNIVFPETENLFHYKNNKQGPEISDVDLSKISPVIIWGAHPCDAFSFSVLKTIFMSDAQDIFFKTRLDKLTLIGLTCHQSDENCFCTSVGLKPDGTEGSDILLTKLTSGDYLAEIVTEKGQNIHLKYPDFFQPVVNNLVREEPAKVEKKFDSRELSKKLPSFFEHPFWIENSLRCIGCGACAFVCPTCGCFDIQDESNGNSGRRVRCWDSCGFSLFTIHASRHNPRELQSQRWRQRIFHKFSYMPEKDNLPGCIGCGRCSRACPVDMNILEQLIKLEKLT